MRKNIHPSYAKVAFHDTSIDRYFIIGSTATSDTTVEVDGVTYPYIALDVSSASHPFYTGEKRAIEKAGRISRFKERYSGFSKGQE